jgi:hypothetical protein
MIPELPEQPVQTWLAETPCSERMYSGERQRFEAFVTSNAGEKPYRPASCFGRLVVTNLRIAFLSCGGRMFPGAEWCQWELQDGKLAIPEVHWLQSEPQSMGLSQTEFPISRLISSNLGEAGSWCFDQSHIHSVEVIKPFWRQPFLRITASPNRVCRYSVFRADVKDIREWWALRENILRVKQG